MSQRRLRGVDVSAFQGIITDEIVEALVAEGCAFAYVRAVVGNEAAIDTRLLANLEVFRRFGIAVTRYFFPYPLPKLNPEAQAEHHFRLTEKTRRDDDLADVDDAEWPPREDRDKATGRIIDVWGKWGCSAPQLREWHARYLARLDALTGRVSPIYTYPYWGDACVELHREPEITKRALILANYGLKGIVPTDEQIARVKPIRGWDKITVLQHDGDGGLRLPTAKGPNTGLDVDWNVMPDPDDLERWRGKANEPEAPSSASDAFIAELAALGHQGATNLIVEDMIAAYRRERIDST